MSWIKDRMEEKQVVLEQEWLQDKKIYEKQPARNVTEAWDHMIAAIRRDIDEFNALKLCGDQRVDLSETGKILELRWKDRSIPLLTLSLHADQNLIHYSGRVGSAPRDGYLRVGIRRGANAVLYDGRPTPLTYEEASQYLLQPILMP